MIRKLKVSLAFKSGHQVLVGEMLHTERGRIFFQLNPLFLQKKLALSPLKIKPIPEPQTPAENDLDLFGGLFGVFADSLPDGWGLMMMSRAMRRAGTDFNLASTLDQLSFVGKRGMGALVYEPETSTIEDEQAAIDLHQLATEAEQVLDGKTDDVLLELLILGGSPGGARPKVVVGVENGEGKSPRMLSGTHELPPGFEHWLIKFRGKDERPDAGIIEFIYAETARHVGLNVPLTRLFTDSKRGVWFGSKRFDRGPDNSRVHVHTAAGLVHANFRLPSLDYEDLLKITSIVTQREDDLQAAFRIAVFNVLFHNRDDHAKNFSFIMAEDGIWRLAPSYDLTYSNGPGGEHTTAVLGEGRQPTQEHLLKLAEKRGIKRAVATEILQEVEAGRFVMRDLLRQHGIKAHPVSSLLKA